MLSKRVGRATMIVAALSLAGCRSSMPWRNEPIASELNLAFTLENNLLYLDSVRIDGRPGRYLFGSAHARCVLDPRTVSTIGGAWRTHLLQLNQKETIRVSPVLLDLGGVADGIIGGGAFTRHAVTIDYRSGLVTIQKNGMHPGLMTLYAFEGEPAITVHIDGRPTMAIVDTALPDTLVLPGRGSAPERGAARVAIAGTDFGSVDVRFADVARARIGNRLLSKFLVTIDYQRGRVGVWRDPRTDIR